MVNRTIHPEYDPSVPTKDELFTSFAQLIAEVAIYAITNPVDLAKETAKETLDYLDDVAETLTLAHRQGLADIAQEARNIGIQVPAVALFECGLLLTFSPVVYASGFSDRFLGRREIPVSDAPNVVTRLRNLPRRLNDYLNQQAYP